MTHNEVIGISYSSLIDIYSRFTLLCGYFVFFRLFPIVSCNGYQLSFKTDSGNFTVN